MNGVALAWMENAAKAPSDRASIWMHFGAARLASSAQTGKLIAYGND
jgi:hypothetical protein